ncbi:MAG: Mut7-C RNAse domain-containing protein, partial [Proteobacteria bacterium]|nr:Mut7-C RNAse domain-containing protein [Pseudomonadota bacterium]
GAQYPNQEAALASAGAAGTLSRYLRLLGFDVWYDNQYQDSELIKLATENNRIILTRDLPLLKNKKVTRGYWLRNIAPKLQVAEVLKRFDLLRQVKPLTRCLVCNGLIQSVAKQQIEALLPSKTKVFYQTFSQCHQCHKIYWQGAHYQQILNLIAELLP